jgi:putative colanic acid biosynthesis acetyltransferase WcaF
MSAESFARDLKSFTRDGYDKGRPLVMQAAWYAVQNLLFLKWWMPSRARIRLLRLFGASIGSGVFIRAGVRVHWPWKLSIGDNSWLGEGAWLLNLEPITIGHNVCVSQDAMLCTGNHDYKKKTFPYRNGPIVLHDGAWIACRAVIMPNVTVGKNAVVGAGAILSSDLAAGYRYTNDRLISLINYR